MELELKGKVALVTGGSQGIGKGICTELAREGVHVALCARKPGPLAETKAEIERMGVKALALEADVTDTAAIERAVKQTEDRFGRIDILVNNAGGDAANSHFVEDPDEVWEKNYAVNLWPVIRFTRLAVKGMKARKSGTIVNISSVGGKIVSWPGVSDYSSAKSAVMMLTLTWSVDLAPHNIRVNCVNPALIRTPLWEELAKSFVPQLGANVEEVFKSFTERLTIKRTGRPEEVGSLVAYLASDARAGFITGQVWNVDGGYIKTI